MSTRSAAPSLAISDRGDAAAAMFAAQRRLIQHGLIILLIGLVSGFGLGWSAVGVVDLWPLPLAYPDALPGAVELWRGAHTGNLMNGIMAIALGASLGFFALSARGAAWISWALIGAIWCNAVFYAARIVAPNRGLSIGDNALGEGTLSGAIAFLPAFIAAFVTIAVACALLAALKRAD